MANPFVHVELMTTDEKEIGLSRQNAGAPADTANCVREFQTTGVMRTSTVILWSRVPR